MSAKVQTNVRRASWSPTSLALVLMVGVTIGSFGVAARPGLQLSTLRGQSATLQSDIDRIGGLERQLAATDAPDELARLEAVTELLGQLFPERPDSLELYTDLRSAADLSTVELEQVSLATPDEPLGPAAGGDWIHVSHADLTGIAHPGAIARLIDLLRADGRPTLVRRFTLQRESEASTSFRFQIQLAFPFHGPPPAEDDVSSLES